MIWRPRVGDRVRIRYGRRIVRLFAQARLPLPYHDRTGRVIRATRPGGGPVNAQVLFDDGDSAIVPRGNLFAAEEKRCV